MPELREALVRHEPFVRALARRLVRDPNEADDVAQETWRRGLMRAPPLDGFERWLARAVRAVAGARRRGERRRALRERCHAGDGLAREADPARAEEILEHRRTVISVVLELEEPLRRVVLARFYEELGTPDIARTLGLPMETVRTRLKRAREVLRERLERRLGGREELSLALALLDRDSLPSPASLVRRPAALSAARLAMATSTFLGLAVVGGVALEVLRSARGTGPEGTREPFAPREIAIASPEPAGSGQARLPVSAASGTRSRVVDPFWEAVRAARRGARRFVLEDVLAEPDRRLLSALTTTELPAYSAPEESWVQRVDQLARRTGLAIEVDPGSLDVEATLPALELTHPIAIVDVLDLAVEPRGLRWALRDGTVVAGREGSVRGPIACACVSIADLRIDPRDYRPDGEALDPLFPCPPPQEILELVQETNPDAWTRADTLLALGAGIEELPAGLAGTLDARALAEGRILVAWNEAPALARLEETLDALRGFWLPDPELGTPGDGGLWLAARPSGPHYEEHLARLAHTRFTLAPDVRTLGDAAQELARECRLDAWVAPDLRELPVAPCAEARAAMDWLGEWTAEGLAWDVAHGFVRLLASPREADGQILRLFDLRGLLDGQLLLADLLAAGPPLDPGEWPPEEALMSDTLDSWLRDTLAPASWEANPACRLRILDEAGVALMWQSPEAVAEAARRLAVLRLRSRGAPTSSGAGSR